MSMAVGTQRNELVTGQRAEKEKSSPDIQELAGHSKLSLGVLLILNNFTEHQFQTKPLCDYDGERQKQDHFIIVFEYRQKHECHPSHKTAYIPHLQSLPITAFLHLVFSLRFVKILNHKITLISWQHPNSRLSLIPYTIFHITWPKSKCGKYPVLLSNSLCWDLLQFPVVYVFPCWNVWLNNPFNYRSIPVVFC